MSSKHWDIPIVVSVHIETWQLKFEHAIDDSFEEKWHRVSWWSSWDKMNEGINVSGLFYGYFTKEVNLIKFS